MPRGHRTPHEVGCNRPHVPVPRIFLRAVLGDPNSRVDLERHLMNIDSTLDSCEGPGPVDDHRRVRRGTSFEWVMPHTYRKTVATCLTGGVSVPGPSLTSSAMRESR
jgi:hypothetical protein